MTEKKNGKMLKTSINVALVFFIDFLVNIIWSFIIATAFAAIFVLTQRGSLNQEELISYLAENPGFLFAASFYNVFAVLIVKLFWKKVDKSETDMIGLKWRSNSFKLFGFGLLGGTFEIVLIMLISLAAGTLWYESSGFGLYTVGEILRSVFFGIMAFLLVGFGEEAVFRGYIQKRIMLSLGKGWALLLASLIFMAAHLATYARLLDFIDIFLGGLIMGYLYMLTDSLYLPAGYHFIYDLLQVNVVRLQDYEHFKDAVMFIFNNTGDLILSNVNFGNIIEVSFIIAEFLTLMVIYKLRHRLKGMSAEETE